MKALLRRHQYFPTFAETSLDARKLKRRRTSALAQPLSVLQTNAELGRLQVIGLNGNNERREQSKPNKGRLTLLIKFET